MMGKILENELYGTLFKLVNVIYQLFIV